MDDTERLQQIEAELIQTRLAQIDEHIKALEAKALETVKSLETVKTIETAQKNEGVEGVNCKHNAPWVVTNKPSKKSIDRTIYG
ncbi:MAG: hypothetical protein WC340_07860 [Kiritimatiellia bacterium]